MSNLSNLKLGDDVTIEEKDTLGGNFTLESGIYDMNIEVAYMGLSKGGAANINLHLTDGSNTLRQTIYVTSGDAKGNLPYYVDKEGNKKPLPGMSQANAICQMTMGADLGDLETDEKVIKLYDFEAKAEVETKVHMLMDLLGKKVALGVQKRTVDKNVKNDAGVYVPSGETRTENEINKIFQADTHLTTTELKAGVTTAEFASKWEDKWNGVTVDKSTGAAKGTGVTGKAAAPATKSLF